MKKKNSKTYKKILNFFNFIFNNYYIYIYIEQEYKILLPLNKEDIFENVTLVVVNMNNGSKIVVKIKMPLE